MSDDNKVVKLVIAAPPSDSMRERFDRLETENRRKTIENQRLHLENADLRRQVQILEGAVEKLKGVNNDTGYGFLPKQFRPIVELAAERPVSCSDFSGKKETVLRYISHLVRVGWLEESGKGYFSLRERAPLEAPLTDMEKVIVEILSEHGPLSAHDIDKHGGRRQDLPVLLAHRKRTIDKHGNLYSIHER